MSSVRFKLPNIGPKWYSLILCPECNFVVKSTDDMKDSTEELTCPDCGKVFTFEFNSKEDYPKIKVQSVPKSMMNYTLSPEGGFIMRGTDQMKAFTYALMNWQNFVDDQDKPINLTSKLKEQIFQEGAWGLPSFVTMKSQFQQTKKDEQEKN